MKTLKEFVSKTKVEETEIIKESQEIEALETEDSPLFYYEEDVSEHPMDPPAILIMRRKSIRQFPNNQRVSLYFVDKINKYVTVPYTAMQWSATGMPEGVNVEGNIIEEDVMYQLNNIVSNGYTETIMFRDGKTMKVNEQTAKAVLKTYNDLNHENKKNVSEMVNESKEQFSKVVDFARKHSK